MTSKFLTAKIIVSVDSQIFSYSEFYLFLKKILQERGYYIEEKTYTDNTLNSVGSIDFYWNTYKRIDDYTKYFIELNVKMNLDEVSVVRDNKKETMNKGSGSIKIRSTVWTNYADKWEDSNPFISFIRVIFENYLNKGNATEYNKKLTDEAYEIENELKSFFNLQK